MATKYRSRRVTIDNIEFASVAEGLRYRELVLLQRAGAISELVLQVKYPLVVNGVLVCTYVSDFDYVQNGAKVVEDKKGFRTPVFKLKRKLMRAVHGIIIRET